jgi:branched-chain amino acid transport system ATP-binding protein
MLETHHLKAWYGQTRALFDVSVSVSRGQVLALVGTNGAGKSTTVRAILGLVRSTGTVVVDGQDITSWPTHRRVKEAGIAVLHESRNLFGELTVRENLFLGIGARQAHSLSEVTDVFPIIAERMNDPVGSLSGGQRQMVALGRALLSGPNYLILDEPSLGLSPASVDLVYGAIHEFTERNVGVLLIEQNIHKAATAAASLQLITIGRSGDPVQAKDAHGVQLLQDAAFGATE